MKIYLAGPISADSDEVVFANCQRAVDAGIELLPRKGQCSHKCLYCYWRDKNHNSVLKSPGQTPL